ncbi:MAG TPA: Fe-S protein assembly chaperone HscA, partial [Nannocystis sp.]
AEVGHLEELLPPGERAEVEAALAAADAAMADPDAAAEPLNRARTALEKVSEPFARRRMERALAAGMAGKSLHEIERALADDETLQQKRAGHAPELLPREEP